MKKTYSNLYRTFDLSTSGDTKDRLEFDRINALFQHYAWHWQSWKHMLIGDGMNPLIIEESQHAISPHLYSFFEQFKEEMSHITYD